MYDPVSSVGYSIEACLRALHGHLVLLFATMAVVVGVVALVVTSYHQLVARFPKGGGAAAAFGAAFGEGWAFLPLGALIVDYALTIAISVAAGASALISYLPGLAPYRVSMAMVLVVVVAGLTWFGHGGRATFAVMTLVFVGIASLVLVIGFLAPSGHAGPTVTSSTPVRSPALAVLLAFPVGMALATGVEAPSSAIAQLGQLDDAGRRRFGRVTLWLTLGIVGWLTLGLTVLAVRLRVGIPAPGTHSTQIAEIARAAVNSRVLFAAFQLASALLLLAAASSSFQAGPGLLKALARDDTHPGHVGILPSWLGATNRHHTPHWGVVVFLGVSALVVAAAGGRDQELVLFYAVAVFISFLFGLLAMGQLSWRDGRTGSVAFNALGALAVAVTLVMNLARGYPVVSVAAACCLAGGLYWRWVRAGRPRGVSEADRLAEEELGAEERGAKEPSADEAGAGAPRPAGQR